MKKQLALLLAVVLVMTMTPFAFASTVTGNENGLIDSGGLSPNGMIEGNGGVQAPVISYQIPSNLDFALDAFQKGDDTGSQIFSVAFPVKNRSDVALQVSVQPKLVAAGGVTVVYSPDEVNATDPGVTDKQVYMEAAAYTGITMAGAALQAPEFPYNDSADGSPAIATLGTGTEGKMTFALEKATYASGAFSALAVEGGKVTGGGMFRFMGSVNPVANWAANDVKVQAVFDITPLTPEMYSSLMSAEGAVKTANVAAVTSAEAANAPPKLSASGDPRPNAAFTFSYTDGKGDKLVNGVSGVSVNGTPLTVTTYYTVNTSAKTITLKKEALVLFNTAATNEIVVTFNLASGNGTTTSTLKTKAVS